MSELLINIVLWASQVFYFACFVPQIIINYSMGSCSGLSDVLLFGYLNGYFAFFYYLYCSSFSAFDEVMTVLQFFAILILVLQRFYYSRTTASANRFFVLIFANFLLASFFIPFAYKNPQLVGNIGGWVAAIFFCLSQLFQIFKIHISKSVAGFSFLFVFLILFGAILELVVAYVLKYPMQSRLGLWRLVVGCGIYCVQFYIYKK
ncbi:MAG: PQ-loop repeat-containing protein [bacterium]